MILSATLVNRAATVRLSASSTPDKQNQGRSLLKNHAVYSSNSYFSLGTSAQSEERSVSTHDVTGFRKTANMLDSPASEEAVHGGSDSVGSSSITSGLESPHGSVDKYGQESAPRVDSNPADLGHGANVDSSSAPSVVIPQLRPSPKQAGKQDTLNAPAPHSMRDKSDGLKAQFKGLSVDVCVFPPSE